jgi:hypothetical protein
MVATLDGRSVNGGDPVQVQVAVKVDVKVNARVHSMPSRAERA